MNQLLNAGLARSSAILFAALMFPGLAMAEEATELPLDLTGSGVGIAAIVVFLVAYILVMSEEYTDL